MQILLLIDFEYANVLTVQYTDVCLRSKSNKTETAVQSQDDEKNWHGRQSLNLIKKTENPLQDSARFCKILQDSARFCKILQEPTRAFTGIT